MIFDSNTIVRILFKTNCFTLDKKNNIAYVDKVAAICSKRQSLI